MTGTRVDGPRLSRYVVRIERGDGQLRGTGFFVAPGLVLTCAHVVSGLSQVSITPHSDVSGPVTATVAARSAEPRDDDPVWPFPDLALLRLDSAVDHPCVLLSAAEPDTSQDSYAWGYAQYLPGNSWPAGPATFRFEDRQSDGYLKLKAGEAAPGLSGAPLLCPESRAVVGVVCMTRAEDSDRGAWASPISALFGEIPGAPRDLVDLGRTVRAENRAVSLAGRAAWNRVLPIKGADELLDRPWRPFVRQQRSSPADLLLADYGVVPYLFRGGDIDEMVGWCEEDAEMAVSVVIGHGGAGKTRFAVELCNRMIERGWVAGLWPDWSSVTLAQRAGTLVNLPLPRLIVIDYAEASMADALRSTFGDLSKRADTLAPVRILLLVRTASNSIRDLLGEIGNRAPGKLRTVLDAAREIDSATQALALAQRGELYSAALGRFTTAWFGACADAREPASMRIPDLSNDRYALPLEVLFEAFDHTFTGAHAGAGDLPPVQRVLDHETKHWDAGAPAGLGAAARVRCVAVATLAGAADESEAHTLLVATVPALAGPEAAELRTRVVDWLAGLYLGPALLNPLRPDRLGEALVARLLGDLNGRAAGSPSELLRSILTLPASQQVANCLDVLARLSVYDQRASQSASVAMTALHARLVARAESLARESQEQSGRITVASGLIRLLSGETGTLLMDAEPGDTVYQRELANSFTKLGDLAVGAAQYTQAERLYRNGLQVRERLAALGRSRAENVFEAAESYDRLGSLAQRTGESSKSAALYRQAIAVAQTAVQREPDRAENYHALAEYYGSLSKALLAAKRAQEAQECMLTSVEIRRRARAVEEGRSLEPGGLERVISERATGTTGAGGLNPASHAVAVSARPPAVSASADLPAAAEARIDLPANGKIVTFYSFKGGVGRTMALANVAWILAANGLRVLAVDFDLEAPDLHRYFRAFLASDELADGPGVVDLIRTYEWEAVRRDDARSQEQDWYRRYAQTHDYAVSLDWGFPGRGSLDYLSAGRQNRDYSSSVATLDWDNFYDRLRGGYFFDALRDDMKAKYDYVLIDSRTGLSDVADICTAHLPDIVVDCFSLTAQSIDAASSIAHSITRLSPREIRVLPVPMRVDDGEKEMIDRGRNYARTRFDQFPQHLTEYERHRYWTSVEIPYRPFYAYRETLACFADRAGSPSSLLSAMERLAEWITHGAVRAMPAIGEPERLAILDASNREFLPQSSAVRLVYAPEDQLWVDWISTVLADADLRVTLVNAAESDPLLSASPNDLNVVVVSHSLVRTGVDLSEASRQIVPIVVDDVVLQGGLPAQHALVLNGVDLNGLTEARATESLLRSVQSSGSVAIQPLRLPGDAAPSEATRFPAAGPSVINAPPRNPSFVGRNSELQALRQQLTESNFVALRGFPLHGLGGVGKTQIVIEYAYRFSADYDLIWWIDAERSEAALAQLAGRLDLQVGGGSVADAAREAVSALSRGEPYRRWLLIFDNADDPGGIRDLIPHGLGHVLITTRAQAWDQVCTTLDIDVFRRDESMQLLTRRVTGISPPEASQIAEALGDLPLALTMSAAWLEQTGMPVEQYLRALQDSVAELFESDSVPRAPSGMDAVWRVSIEQLRQRSPAAVPLLRLFAFCAPEISLELIEQQATVEALLPYDGLLRERMMLGRVIRELGRSSLAKVDRGANVLHVHRLLQTFLRQEMRAEERHEAMHQVHRILAAARPTSGIDDPANWPRYALLWPHLEPSGAIQCDEPEVRDLLIDRMSMLRSYGDFESALQLARLVEERWEAALAGETEQAGFFGGPEELERQLLQLRSQRAAVYRAQGEFAAAAELDRAVLARQEVLLQTDHPHVLFTARGMAADLRALGRFTEAQSMDTETYRTLVEEYGEDHPQTLAAASDLALDHSLNGDYASALELDRATLDQRRAVLGAAHPFTLASARNLARDLRETGDYDGSVAMLQTTYAEFVEVLSESFAETLRTAVSLGTSLRYAGFHIQSRTLIEEAFARYTDEYGADTPDAYACKASLAAAVAATGDTALASDLIDSAYSDYVRRFGPEHPFTLAVLHNAAVYQLQNSQVVQASAVARQVAEQLAEALGPDHPHTLIARLNLANCLAAGDDAEAGAALDESVYDALHNLLGEQHPLTLAAGMNLADSLAKSGRAAAAQTLRGRLQPAFEHRYGKEHPTLMQVVSGGRVVWEIEPQPV